MYRNALQKLVLKAEKQQTHARLINWGRWLKYDNTFAKLGYPKHAPFVFIPYKGKMIADLDAEHIEFIVSTLAVAGRNSPELCRDGLLHSFILKIEYGETIREKKRPVADRAEDVRRRFNRPCSEKTYYYHLARAKRAVRLLAGPVKN